MRTVHPASWKYADPEAVDWAMAQERIDLSDVTLFGNDAAEEEDVAVFNSYAILPEGVERFFDDKAKMVFVRAYKGDGKSALIRMKSQALRTAVGGQGIVVAAEGSDVSPHIASEDFASWVRAWKKSITNAIAVEVGKKIGFAWHDDDMSLVEAAEQAGARPRSPVGAILDRIPFDKLHLGPAQLEGLGIKRTGADTAPEALKRWANNRPPLWVFLDDIDRNFSGSKQDLVRIGSFFDAVRELSRAIPELRIRGAIRPNVWTLLRLEYESMSHSDQYMLDLAWSVEMAARMLAARVKGYLTRTEQHAKLNEISNSFSRTTRIDRELIRLAFDDPISWGKEQRPPIVPLFTLSKHRPRWLVELSKVAAKVATARGKPRIGRDEILTDYTAFSQRRMHDTIAEFRSYCPEVGEILSAFHRAKEEMATDELMTVIDRNVLSHLSPRLPEAPGGRAKPRDVAAFLFQIGFFYGRRDLPEGGYQHVTFSEQPTLFASRVNPDQGLRWEIHPVFRQALEIRDSRGFETHSGRERG